jgi:hypothetical protein
MKSVDYLKELSSLYNQKKNEVAFLEVPRMNFLMIDGTGSPNNNPDYSDAVGALYALAFHLKFSVKKGPLGIDYKVMPLEGLWWAEDMRLFTLENRDNWLWRMMIMQPDFITTKMFDEAVDAVRKKKNPPRLDDVCFGAVDEGLSAQIFHAGPYGEAERPSIERLHQEISDQGYKLRGRHHEIYLNSPLRTDPSKLKTIIRQPVELAG